MWKRSILYLSVAVSIVSCFKDPPATPLIEVSTAVLTEQLQFPWEIAWGPDNFIWITERSGNVKRIDPSDGTVASSFAISDVETNGEGGLLGMAFHPQFSSNPYVYLAYDYNKAGMYTGKIVRYTYSSNALSSPVILLDDLAAAAIHNGCRLLVSPDGKLFISTGDASDQTLPQNTASLNGKILRINLDGSIPADNPFPGSAVWSKGHRNAQGMIFVQDSLFSSEHGPDSDDEINIIHKGSNYGWPDVKGSCDTDEQSFCIANNVAEPIWKWTPTIAVCGLDYYNNDLIPQWKNSLLMCTLKGSRFIQLQLNNAHTQITETTDFFADNYGRLRDLCISPDGKVYFCTSNGANDKIIEVSSK